MLRRFVSCIALLTLVSIFPHTPAYAAAPAVQDTSTNLILFADFSDGTIGSPPNTGLPGPPVGDHLTLNQAGGFIHVSDVANGMVNPVEMHQFDGQAGGLDLNAYSLPNAGCNEVTVSWRSMVRSDNDPTFFAIQLESSTGKVIASVGYRPLHILTYNSLGESTGPTIPDGYVSDRNQYFTIVADFLAHTASLSIDGVPIGGFQGLPFLEPAEDLANLHFLSRGTPLAIYELDDISAVALCGDAPPVVSAPLGIDGEEGGTLSFTIGASDPDGQAIDALTPDLTSLPVGNDATFTAAGDHSSGTLLWHMQPGQAGTYPVTFTASNTLSASATTVITVAPAGVSATGVFSWTPQVGQEGVYHVTFTATDPGGTSTFTSTINVVSGFLTASPAARLSVRAPEAALSPQAPQKGPVISGTTATQTTTAAPTVLSVSVSPAVAASALPTGVLRAASIALAGKAAQSINIFVDTSELPPANNSALAVDHEPNINGLTAITVDAGVMLTLFRGAIDPDGDPIDSFGADLSGLPAGNGATWTLNGSNTVGTLHWTPKVTEVGTFIVSFTATNRLVSHGSTAITVRAAASTRVFIAGNPKIRLSSNRPFQCFQIEPVGGSFDLTDVDPATIRLISPGTGAVSEIAPAVGKTIVIGDRDGNLIPDMGVCFSKANMRLLFSLLHGKSTVTVAIQGQLITGSYFRGELSVEVNASGGGGVASATVSPNPLNPQAKLAFTVVKPGFVRVRLYDLQGRLIREVLNETAASVGPREVSIDGRDHSGRTLASGVYFYRIETAAGIDVGRFAIVR